MHRDQITTLFDQHAASYDEKWQPTAPLNDALHLLSASILSQLPSDVRILCVGSGTGAEILSLAEQFPGWHFTAVEPSAAMQTVFRKRAEALGIADRCISHTGYLETLPTQPPFHAATAFLVSQFIIDRSQRVQFFQHIADRLATDGHLLSSDLAGDPASPEFPRQLETWHRLTQQEAPTPEKIAQLLKTYTTDVAVIPPDSIQTIISQGGFQNPIPFYQASLIHAWSAQRA